MKQQQELDEYRATLFNSGQQWMLWYSTPFGKKLPKILHFLFPDSWLGSWKPGLKIPNASPEEAREKSLKDLNRTIDRR